MSRRSRAVPPRVLQAAALAACLAAAAPSVAAEAVPLVWHVESPDGKVIDSRDADRAVNPASVVKLATSLRALATLGEKHRFTTTFLVTEGGGLLGPRAGLVVEGGADPDFHFENAVVVARALATAGHGRIRGDLYVGGKFWIGWERGTAGRDPDETRRRIEMGRRLVEAWNPNKWSAEQKVAWVNVAARHGWDAASPPEVRIDGKVRTDLPGGATKVVEHRSEPLLVALRRFNVFSNNDIERLDASVGPPSGLPAFLGERLGEEAAATSFSTSSGLNRNRMSPRVVVRMLRDLRGLLEAKGLGMADMMPVLGCGPSTLRELFPRLVASGDADGLVGKTGTLNLQDGGVSALAGYLPAGPGFVFFVAAPGTGPDLRRARAAEEDWVRRVLLARGSVPPLVCPPPVPASDEQAEVVVAAPALAAR